MSSSTPNGKNRKAYHLKAISELNIGPFFVSFSLHKLEAVLSKVCMRFGIASDETGEFSLPSRLGSNFSHWYHNLRLNYNIT